MKEGFWICEWSFSRTWKLRKGRGAEGPNLLSLLSKFLTFQSYTLLHPYGLREIHLVGVLKRKIGRDEVLMEAENSRNFSGVK